MGGLRSAALVETMQVETDFPVKTIVFPDNLL